MSDLIIGAIVGRFRIEAQLGSGGMADVYRVSHLDLGVQRALKVLRLQDSDIQKRFSREGRIQAQLKHENIVEVVDTMDVRGSPALVLEYVSGGNLSEAISARSLDWEQRERIALGIFAAVEAAHERKIIHRDLKPANVLLDDRGGNLVAKVADFGIARVLRPDGLGGRQLPLTAENVSAGTIRYAAPEQLGDARAADERSDIWSIGAILYELVCGDRPFPGPSVTPSLSSLTDLAPGVPKRATDAVVAALKIDPDERCATVAELRDIWTGVARPRGGGGRAGPKRRGRGPLGYTFGSCAVVVGLGVVGLGLVGVLAGALLSNRTSTNEGEADSDAIAEVVSPVDSDTVEVVDEPVDSDEGDNEPTEVVERPVVPAEKRDGPIVEERPPPRRVVELICPESLRVNCHDDQGERLVSAACDASESSRLNVPGGVEVTCIVQSDGWRNACVLAPAKVPTRLRVDPESTGCEWE